MGPVLAVFGLGGAELIVVGLIVLLLFGSRLPSVMRSLGQSVTSFKSGLNDDEEDEEKKKQKLDDNKK
jgi:sec-independent protein translocase protein TatA